jgi:type I restriction-modification system DNA methylase subunit
MTYLNDDYTKPVLDSLTNVRQQTGYDWSRVFRDWIDVVFLSLQRDDDGHGELVDSYETDFGEDTTQTAFEAYSEAFGDFLVATGETNADVLGCLYQEYGSPSTEHGQHFTPPNVARLLGEMLVPNTGSIHDSTPENPIPIHDPTCGSGSLLLGAGQRLEDLAESPYAAVFIGQDIDIRCTKMTAINFAVCGLPGFAIHGDSLKNEPVAGWKVMPSEGLMGAPIRECEQPPTFGATTSSNSSSNSSPPTAADGSGDSTGSQQVRFSAFTDDASSQ